MIQVFCNERGAGKTKELISLANRRMSETKGDSVYIDDDCKYIRQVDRRIRFIATDDYNIVDCDSFYGLLCGIISANYDVENIYIDNIFNIISYEKEDMINLLRKIDLLSQKNNFNIYINLTYGKNDLPELIKKYVA